MDLVTYPLSAIQRPGPGGAPEGEAGHDSLTSRRRNASIPSVLLSGLA